MRLRVQVAQCALDGRAQVLVSAVVVQRASAVDEQRIWATGYDLNCEWIDAPILDDLGCPRNARGVAAIPGLYSLGPLWQHSQASASLLGPELDGPYLVDMVARQAPRRRAIATVAARDG